MEPLIYLKSHSGWKANQTLIKALEAEMIQRGFRPKTFVYGHYKLSEYLEGLKHAPFMVAFTPWETVLVHAVYCCCVMLLCAHNLIILCSY
jgi:hypothetical protein